MGSTFWPNRIFERQSSHNRHTGLKFAWKRENSALSMKIVQNALFRSCGARFGQIAFVSGKVLKIVTLALNSLPNEKTAPFPWKLYKTLFSGHAQYVLAKSNFWASKFSRSSHWPQILFKTGKQCAFYENCTNKTLFLGHAQHVLAKSHFRASKFSKSSHWPEFLAQTVKQCAFHENCTKRSFQVMGSTFWPNYIFERQSSNNRHTRLKFASKRENSALSMKIVQNAFFRLCGARFGQIASLGVIVVKFVTLAWNSRQNGKTVPFPWKLYKTLFSGHEQHVLAKSNLWDSNFSKSLHLSQILAKTGKQCAIHENCAKRSFQVLGSTFWPNRIFDRQSSHNRHTRLKFASKRKNSALSMKIVQNALFRSCAARFGQIAFLSVKVLKIVTLASNSVQNGKTVPFPWKLYKTLFSDHVQHVMGRSHFWESKFSQSSHWPQILSKNGKQCAFHKNCTKRSFQVMRSTFWPNRILERQSSQNRHTGLNFSP